MNRRSLLGGLSSLVAGAAVGLAARRSEAKPALRPPGARSEEDLRARCIGCLRCEEVCPVSAIQFARGAGLKSTLPAIDAAARGCTLCMQCTWACPTGALEWLPADAKVVQQRVHLGEPVLDKQRCLAWNGSGVCRACYCVCPYPDSAITLNGPRLAPLFVAKDCTGCGLCEEACPRRARAIRIAPWGQR